MSTPEPKRLRLSPEARRKQLMDVSVEILLEHPIDALTVDELAGRAGVSKSLVFHYFPTIRDLHLAVLQLMADYLVGQIDAARGDGPPEEQLANGVGAYIDFITLQPRSFDVLSAMSATDPDYGAVFDAVRQQATHLATLGFEGRTGPLGDYVLAGWISFVETMMRSWVADPAGIERAELVDRILEGTRALIVVADTATPRPS